MTDAAAWQRAADPARRLGHAVEFHASIGSTSDRARELLAAGREGIAVVADLQTAGRGRRGRAWESPPGVNLMVSVAFRPSLDPAALGLLGLAAALAARSACVTAAGGRPLWLRWPNDLVAADGAKLAGVLVETALVEGRPADAVVGIGINANWRRADMPPELVERATSLCELTGTDVDRVALLSLLLGALDGELRALEDGRSPVPRAREADALAGRQVRVDTGSEVLGGRSLGIDEDGALLLETHGERRALHAGEVVAVREALPA
ncbi:MAG TPA: biotin--[acetyl-CoA-carboxylase] ligase [candidate division Zixibacteria bacterium]|nr:biotin--[acetyl-CoA-carboxylase] ligase [candidate division Zixibacteria bacterium]